MEQKSFMEATGNIDYNMTNDYMFRVILQENKVALKGLLCSLLRLKSHEIHTVTITNPIVPGETIDAKTFFLDVNIVMNNNTIINLEMQVANEYNWTNRSLSYISRSFADMYRGQKYIDAKPVIHIGFLNYTLFKEYPEFYAKYKITNEKYNYVFNDNFIIGVVNLNATELATDEDKEYDLDKWVKLFKAKTWEELKMIAEKKPELLEASEALYKYNSDLHVRQQCIAFDDYMRNMSHIETLEERNKKMESDIVILTDVNEKLESEKEKLENKNEKLESEKEKLENKNEKLESEKEKLENKNEKLESEKEKLENKNEKLESDIVTLTDENKKLEKELEQMRALLFANGITDVNK